MGKRIKATNTRDVCFENNSVAYSGRLCEDKPFNTIFLDKFYPYIRSSNSEKK
jgi:hypothetical protein